MVVPGELVAAVIVVLVIALGVCLVEIFAGMPRSRKPVVLNLANGAGSIRGLLYNRRGRWLIVKDPTYFANGSEVGQRVPGEVLVDRGQVEWIQVIA